MIRLSRLVPRALAPRARDLRAWWLRGDRVECPCCGGRFRAFLPAGRPPQPGALCPRCSSLKRHRLLWLFLGAHPELLRPPLRVLVVAPEEQLQGLLRARPGLTVVSGDLCSELAMARLDLERLPLPDASVGAAICSHVLEHVHDARVALGELRRVLRPGGWALLQSPLDRARERTFEDPTVTDRAGRRRVFGQEDHVRVFGRDYPDWLAGAGFEVEVVPFARELGPERAARFGLDPDERVHLCRRPAEAQVGSSRSRSPRSA